MLYLTPKFHKVGDRGLLVEYGSSIDIETSRLVRSVAAGIKHPGIIEAIPAYRSLTIVYNPTLTTARELENYISNSYFPLLSDNPNVIEVPLYYNEESGPDAKDLALARNMTVEELLKIYCSAEYYVHMIGFTPGFPFLGGLPDVLHYPRRTVPRKFVAAGSIGIANDQTGIYSIGSPGGWQIIGRTPFKLFDPERFPHLTLFRAGDRIKFRQISKEEYESF